MSDEESEEECAIEVMPMQRTRCRRLSRRTACASPPTTKSFRMRVSPPAGAPPPARSNVAQ
eukprot:547707-Ditylum_brightwellii.AAC.1